MRARGNALPPKAAQPGRAAARRGGLGTPSLPLAVTPYGRTDLLGPSSRGQRRTATTSRKVTKLHRACHCSLTQSWTFSQDAAGGQPFHDPMLHESDAAWSTRSIGGASAGSLETGPPSPEYSGLPLGQQHILRKRTPCWTARESTAASPPRPCGPSRPGMRTRTNKA